MKLTPLISTALLMTAVSTQAAVIAAFDINSGASPTAAGFVGFSSSLNGTNGTVTMSNTVVQNSGQGFRDRGATQGDDLFRDLYFANGTVAIPSSMTTTLSGLSANTEYEITVWHFNATAFQREATWYLGSPAGAVLATHKVTGTYPLGTVDPSVSFNVTTSGTGTVTFVQVGTDAGGSSVILNGLTVATIPEPVTTGLFALAGGLVLVRRRRSIS